MSGALVIGAGPGLGLALARRFGLEQLDVGLVVHDERSADELRRALAVEDIEATTAVAEISDEEGLRQAIRDLAHETGPVEVAIFNASAFVEGTPSHVDIQNFEEGMRIGVVGALIMVQEVADQMVDRASGTVLFTGSSVGLRPWPEGSALSAEKAALRSLALSTAEELRPQGVHAAIVTVNGAILPGSPLDPHAIADEFWRVHSQPVEHWEHDVIFDGHR